MTTKPKVKLKLPRRRSLIGSAGLAVVGVVLVVLGVLWFALTVYIGPDEFAVRQVFLGPGKGVQEQVFGPGLRVVIPGYERLYMFPRDMQVLELNDEEYNRGERHREDVDVAPAIRIQTSEGYQVTVDVTVLYRIIDPYLVRTRIPGGLYMEKVVLPEADKILRQTLGMLDAEDFYSDVKRMEKAEKARQQLAAQVEPYGIQVWGVMVRDYIYDSRYQQLIEDRKIQDQSVFKNQAEAVAASREAEKNRVLAEGAANIEIERERGRAEIRKIRADADLYYRQKIAEGDLLVALAEAEGTELENRALALLGDLRPEILVADLIGRVDELVVPGGDRVVLHLIASMPGG